MKTHAEARRILDALERHHPDADTELVFRTPFELLVATLLSAQSTDARVNQVSPALFARYPDARRLVAAEPEALEGLIHSTGFFRQKARALLGMARLIVDEHKGEVPASIDALVALPGVGRKTANVVLGHALGIPGFPVDRHVLRVTNRLGLIHTDEAVAAETALCGFYPKAKWTQASDTFILHGRRICRPKPLCPRCHARPDCDAFVRGEVGMVAVKPAPAAAAAQRAKAANLRPVRAVKPATGVIKATATARAKS